MICATLIPPCVKEDYWKNKYISIIDDKNLLVLVLCVRTCHSHSMFLQLQQREMHMKVKETFLWVTNVVWSLYDCKLWWTNRRLCHSFCCHLAVSCHGARLCPPQRHTKHIDTMIVVWIGNWVRVNKSIFKTCYLPGISLEPIYPAGFCPHGSQCGSCWHLLSSATNATAVY